MQSRRGQPKGGDGRARTPLRAVALTERGREVTEAAMKVAAEITTATLAPLSADEQRILTRLLKKLS